MLEVLHCSYSLCQSFLQGPYAHRPRCWFYTPHAVQSPAATLKQKSRVLPSYICTWITIQSYPISPCLLLSVKSTC